MAVKLTGGILRTAAVDRAGHTCLPQRLTARVYDNYLLSEGVRKATGHTKIPSDSRTVKKGACSGKQATDQTAPEHQGDIFGAKRKTANPNPAEVTRNPLHLFPRQTAAEGEERVKLLGRLESTVNEERRQLLSQ
ncbi:hypothetical protein C0Q70_01570 [Pomacea canaliculata]|uniref:Uncharacterized protein n=1 Tax=Pomacea canaliculata TaxID=400727 RepID=A0A2T7PZU1_POMCA|nr:hypothetical protein C0Q70_01570 [Pomacea canaliculata]